MKRFIIFISYFSFIFSEIDISGNARIRPRMDIKNNSSEGVKSESDLYYLYRTRINLKADIGKGYFFKSILGTNDVAGMSKMGNDGDFTAGPKSSNTNSARPQVDFLELYFGYKNENSSLLAGALPIKHNPALDIHYYPNNIVDIPWLLLNNGTITGFSGFRKLNKLKLNWFLSVDKQLSKNSVECDGECLPSNEKQNDTYTLGFNTSIDLGPIKITPLLFYTISDTNHYAPITFGSKLQLPTIIGFNCSSSYYISNNANENINEGLEKYSTNHLRISLDRKIGSGKANFFYDLASYTPKDKTQMNLSYLWFSYSYVLYNSENGSISLKPTIRIQNGNITNKNYSRTKFELTTEIKFK